MRLCTLLISLLFLTTLTFAQGPISGFMPQEHQLDLAFTYSQETYDDFFNEEGELIPRELTAISYSSFIEYGINDKSAIVATLPYISHNPNNKGLQDGNIWYKYRNERTERKLGNHDIITAIGLSLPFGNYPSDNSYAIGSRASTFQARLLWQYGANKGWFIHAQSGLDFQFAPTTQVAIPLLVRGGIGTSIFYADIWIERYQSINNNPALSGSSVAGINSSWTRTGGTFYVPIRPWVGVFTGGAIILGGKQIGHSKRWNLGTVIRL